MWWKKRSRYAEMQQLVGKIPVYTPGDEITAVLIVTSTDLEKLPVEVVELSDTSVAGIHLARVRVSAGKRI